MFGRSRARHVCWMGWAWVLCVGLGCLQAGEPDKQPAGNVQGAGTVADCPECAPAASESDLFANYYVPPVCGGVGAQLYVSPGPVPPYVGHTYITYQPLMPHEFLYPHYHSYYRYYDGGRGMTRAKTVYYYPPIRTWAVGIVHHFRIPR
ncbi:MAG: hypothetical protein KatS3mg109_1701 [Pirellulaceae bacterium]|nr:MAG: hypothetical protein KatS3mg109_1701 [Pirellulaceae bacterium]GIW94030.1 MAG: hypothetical protein KatS3mg110_2071 [Pirellulaceae bacterium]